MLNQVVLVGRVSDMTEDGYVVMTVSRTYKNNEGDYLNDVVPVKVTGSIKDSVYEYCQKGDMIGIKGAIVSTFEDGFDIAIQAEKVTFLSSKKEDKEED